MEIEIVLWSLRLGKNKVQKQVSEKERKKTSLYRRSGATRC